MTSDVSVQSCGASDAGSMTGNTLAARRLFDCGSALKPCSRVVKSVADRD
jgi:hypothetical protein